MKWIQTVLQTNLKCKIENIARYNVKWYSYTAETKSNNDKPSYGDTTRS